MMKSNKTKYYVLPCLALLSTALCGWPAWADEPMYEMQAANRATYVDIDIYTVRQGAESEFLTAALRAGAYDRIATGFGSEKIIEVLPASANAAPTYAIISRYFDRGTSRIIKRQRPSAVKKFLSSKTAPVHVEGKLVDVILSDWSWERNRTKGKLRPAESFMHAMPYQNEESVFQQYTASLNFMKIGYVGQTASVELFAPGTSLDTIRTAIRSRPGLSGTAVVELSGGQGYAAYTEYYELPPEMKAISLERTKAGAPRGLPGVVIENYMAR